MAVLWHRIFSRFNVVSIYLQTVDVDLNTANNMILSLVDFIKILRSEFTKMENESKELSSFVVQEYSNFGKRTIIKKLRDGEKEIPKLHGSDKFRVETFYLIIDKLITELKKRSEAYTHIVDLFGFLCKLLTMNRDEMQMKALNLVKTYSKDLQNSLICELDQFTALLKLQPQGFFSNHTKIPDEKVNSLSPLKVLNWIVDRQMIDIFPNIYIAYRLFVTIPIANCEAERSFSVLKRIKNMYRATMLDNRLSFLARLTIESDLLRSIDCEDLIQEFAKLKIRKQHFN